MKQETLEEAAENYGWRIKKNTFSDVIKANELADSAKHDFIEGAKWQAERMYSEEDMIEFNEWVSLNFPNQHNYLRALQKYNQGLDVPKEHLVGYCSTKELLDKFKNI